MKNFKRNNTQWTQLILTEKNIEKYNFLKKNIFTTLKLLLGKIHININLLFLYL